ncbi:MAG: acyl carrier protein [Okeania sp. SIO2F4]|uniref:acyl carrier protein n=1 Tax=Okeania sp. SIO2F4 TaxID=2607790 RepID=UPI00142CCCC1|nr:acyl carrier protein [Okeania sp. SIO2F4]NES01523.1 acyl carrier protein [Okeania sp. SIO2F4]
MSNEDTFTKVREIVSKQLEKDLEDVKPESNFANDLGADSLDTVELVMALEEEFELEIPDEQAEQIATVQAAVDYIEKQTTAKA